ncbi:mechanosensitive ion channel [Pedobacter sp. BS3]|uniref:mechanosensitive ion channel family protein n=1 Tax=Pedobacter sp. BS3 TaxID=2567937 RepID=UPI0011F070F7|nr:mechanosensitive ion channel family protein [Pedobacter sp. BS3]TZF83036.1 mechanosensitive ion channel [Pedobacter sp. BS3]
MFRLDNTFWQHEIWGNSLKSYVLFLSILLVGIILKRIFSRLISKLLYRLFGRFKEGVKAQTFVSLLLKPIELFILLDVIYLAINQLSYPLDEIIFRRHTVVDKKTITYSVTLIDVIDKLFLFLIIVSLFWIILRIIDFIAHVFANRAAQSGSRAESQLIQYLKELVKIVTCIIGIFVILGSVFNLNVATLIAGLGIGGIAIALAAKETLENLLGSFTIFIDKPFIVGDYIKVDSIEGTVEKVGFRSTQIRTSEKTIISLPNKRMIDSALENQTLRNARRVKFFIGLTYDTPPETIQQICSELVEKINQHPQTGNDALVNFDNFGDWSLNLQVLYHTDILDYAEHMKIREEINYQIIETVKKRGSDFAFPTQVSIQQ